MKNITFVSVCSLAFIASEATAKPSPSLERDWQKLSAPISVKNPQTRLADPVADKAAKTMQVFVRLNTRGHKDKLMNDQDAFVSRTMRLGKRTRVLGRVQTVLNGVFLEVSPSMIKELEADPMVMHVHEVRNYQMDLTETVPYIGGTAVQSLGFDGSGIRVAVIDSGIDYKHIELGGSGDVAEYEADDPTVLEAGSFPTAKVIGGFDFVGQNWPNSPLEPDPDPIDHGGHGTHVADIIGGTLGVAPGVSFYAFQVCSAVTTACSGVGLIQAMDAAADPNGDGDTSDHVDIINMSLGQDYGQPFDDDLTAAVENATNLGIMTVSSAGNGSDRPYVAGTPASARSALSVAQTAVPSSELGFVTVLSPPAAAGDYIAARQPWSTNLAAPITGTVIYGNGVGNRNGCAPFAPGSVTGAIVIVDRGVCTFTDKIRNIASGGAALGIIGLIAAGDPFEGSFSPGTPVTIPGYMVSQTTSLILRAGAQVTIDPAHIIPLVGSMITTSSRGPRFGDSLLKPEIGAPGGSVSAIAGTGTEMAAFSGTSGASPMVAGSAALVMQARSLDIPPTGFARALAVKSLLMNNAETNIRRDFTGVLAEVSRIGAGEVRVDRAVSAPAVVFGKTENAPSISLGFVDVGKNTVVIHRKAKIVNFSSSNIHYNVSSSIRFARNANGVVQVQTPSVVNASARGFTELELTFVIDGTLLRPNGMSSGQEGATPSRLTDQELDGYITFDDGVHPIHLPWHVLPRRSSDLVPNPGVLPARGTTKHVSLVNNGPGDAQNEAFSLIAVSGDLPAGPIGGQSPTPDIRAVGVNTTIVPPGVCSANDSFVWSFAFNTHERQSHLLPVIHEVDIDLGRDGSFEFSIINEDLTFLQTQNALGGTTLTWAIDNSTGIANAFFFTEHATNTANTVLRVCAEQIGMTIADLGVRQVDAILSSNDFFFGGPGDVVTGLVLTPGGEQFTSTVDAVVASGASGSLDVTDNGALPGASAELGVLLITNSDFGPGFRGGATKRSEALVLPIRGVTLPF